MKSEEFARKLAALAPTVLELIPPLNSVDNQEIFFREFTPIRLDQARHLSLITNTELDNLLANYDMSRVHIMGDITFCEEPFFDEGLLTVATSQNGIFTVSDSGAVYLYSEGYEKPEYCCSDSISGFYQALLILSDYYRNRLINNILRADAEARLKYAAQAAIAAGRAAESKNYLDLLNGSLF